MKSQLLSKLLSRKFLQASLIPIFTIEVLLLALYFSVNAYISRETRKTMIEQVKITAIPIVNQSAGRVNDDLRDVARHTQLVRSETERFFQAPEKFGYPNGTPVLKVSDSGTLYKANAQGCGLFYAAKTRKGAAQMEKARRSEGLDPFYEGVLRSTPNLAAVYLNTWDDMNRLCPYLDKLWEQYPSNIEMEDYNFYYLADAKHNPNRKVVWTDVYLDPAGQGWMASAIAPVYRGNFLEGVIGLDITVDKMTANILSQKLPWDASVFLVDSNGMILAMPASVEEVLGLKELKQHVYKSSVTSTVLKPEEFNLTKNPNPAIASAFAAWLKQGSLIGELNVGDQKYLMAQSKIEETGWRLMFLVDQDKVLAPINQLKTLSQFLGYLVLGLMLVFYVVFLSILLYLSKVFARRIARPVESLVFAAQTMGQGQELSSIEESGVQELDRLSFEFRRMQEELRQRTQALIQETVSREIQEHKASVAYQVGLFESTSAYLHNVGNALAGLDGYVRQLEKVIESAKQWPDAYALMESKWQEAEQASAGELRILFERLRTVQVENALPLLTQSTAKIRQIYGEMMSSIRHQQNMFKDSQSANYQMILEPIALKELIEEVVESQLQLMGLGEIAVHLELDNILLKGHQFQIRMGLHNLIKNALESIALQQPAQPQLNVRLSAQKGGAQILIQDNGVGISMEDASRLFQQGFSTKKEGHGLGLHSFLMFLQSRGGSLRAESSGQGHGATFIVEIVDES